VFFHTRCYLLQIGDNATMPRLKTTYVCRGEQRARFVTGEAKTRPLRGARGVRLGSERQNVRPILGD